MSIVELGTNRFQDCRALLGYLGHDVLAVTVSPLQVTLCVPSQEGGPPVALEPNQVTKSGKVTLVRDGLVYSLFAGDRLVLTALKRSEETAHIKLDLRPLGLSIYDDFDGLHIGTNTFSKNDFLAADVAIALG